MKKLILILAAMLIVCLIAAALVYVFVFKDRSYPALKPGDEGQAVGNAQLRLRELQCYTGAADGVYGDTTEAAVRHFEELNGLTRDGALSAEDQEVLYGTDAIACSFSVTYFDVGQGDSALVECDGHRMLIDGGQYAQKMYAILSDHEVGALDAIVCTHPHDDHAGGLAAALNYTTAQSAYCSVAEDSNNSFNDFLKYLELGGTELTVPKPGDSFMIGCAEVTVEGPVSFNETNMNSNSLVLRVCYGDTAFLFTGDAEEDEEAQILESGADVRADVLKVGHHGSDTSSSEAFIDAVSPKLAVISVGSGNSYGHPKQAVLDRFAARGIQVARTDEMGEIRVTSDKTNVALADGAAVSDPVPAETAAPASAVAAEDCTFVINAGNGRFHRPDCESVTKMSAENRQYTDKTAQELLDEGYTACGACKPEESAETQEAQEETTAAIPEGTTFAINTSSKRFHRLDCESVTDTTAGNLAWTDETAEELVAEGYIPCGACTPDQAVEETEAPAAEADYIVNVKSGKFHLPTCSGAKKMKEENKEYFVGTREELIARGLEPCGSCKP